MLFLSAAADLHDDILDESQMKNGKLTVAGKYGTGVALLVGDQMLFKAMKALYTTSKTIVTEKMDSIISAIDEAFVEVGEAHIVEMGFKEKPASNPKSYFRLLERKSAILEAHTRIGALVGDGDEREIENLTRYGRILGTLMTIRDEFIDLFEPKELADRLKNGCLPLPMIYAYQNPLVKKKVMAILSKPEISKKDADIVVDLVFEDRHVKRLRDEMAELSTKALELTTGLCKRKNLELAVNALLDDL
jgi:geranylgeranyl pyrophosphate synthase